MAARELRFPKWTLISVTACAAVMTMSWVALRSNTQEPEAAANSFLDALVDQRFDDAYASLCASDRQARSNAEFAHAISEVARGLRSFDAFTLDPTGAHRTVHFTLDYGTRSDAFDLDVVEERAGWRVCNVFAG